MKTLRIFLLLSFILSTTSHAIEDQDPKLVKYQFGHHQISELKVLNSHDHVQTQQPENAAYELRESTVTAKLFDGQKQFKIKFNYYHSYVEGKRPLFLVLPPIVGWTPLDKGVAETLAFNGIDVILPEIEDIFTTGRSTKEVEDFMVDFTITMKLLIQRVNTDATLNIDRDKVGVFGMSLGAVIAGSFVGMINEIKYAFILAGGGNLAEISEKSEQWKVKAFKKYILQSGEASESDWTLTIQTAFSFDPLHFAENAKLDGKKIFMVMCKEDLIIPFGLQKQLWQAYGQPPAREVGFYSHLGTIIQWFMRSRFELIDFIKKN